LAFNRSPPGHAGFVVVRDYPPADLQQRWRKCLQNADFATHYTTPEFFHEPFFSGKEPFAVLSIVGNEIAAVCTGIHDGRSIKCGLSVRPQVAISCAADIEPAVAGLAAGLGEEAQSCDLVDIFAWSRLPGLTCWGFRGRDEEGTVVLDLSLGPDALFRKFSANRRTNIKKAINAGVTVDIAGSRADIAAFYEIYCGWSMRKGLLIRPWEEIDKAVSLTANRRLLLARHHGKILAGLIIRFAPSGVMEYAANSSLQESLRLRPNDLLHWRAIQWGCAQGLRSYSLGGSHLFLRKFGGSLVPSYRYRLDRSFLRIHTVRELAFELARIGAGHISRPLRDFGRRLRNSSPREVEIGATKRGKRHENHGDRGSP
jgi:hypothetical protein